MSTRHATMTATVTDGHDKNDPTYTIEWERSPDSTSIITLLDNLNGYTVKIPDKVFTHLADIVREDQQR